jgi:hypothetical protein
MVPEGSSLCTQKPSTFLYPEPYQSISPHSISTKYILILTTHLCRCLPSGLFPTGFHTSDLYAFLISPFVLHSLSFSSFLTWWRVQLWRCTLRSFVLLPIISPLFSPNIPLSNPVLSYHQSMFLPQYQRPSFASIQNHRQNYCFEYCKFIGLNNVLLKFFKMFISNQNYIRIYKLICCDSVWRKEAYKK